MTKADIVEKIHLKTGLTKREASEMMESILEIMKETLEAGEKLKIAGFGNLEVRKKADRIGRNPQTGEAITIKARRVLSFKPSQVLRAAVNK